MNDLEYYIDYVRYQDIPGFERVYVKGWAFSRSQKELVFETKINGFTASCSSVRTRRTDVYETYKKEKIDSEVGFFISVVTSLPVHSFSLAINGNKVIDYGSKKIQKVTDTHYLQYEYDPHPTLESEGTNWVSGYVYSIDGQPVEISIEDKKGNKLEVDYQQADREDIVEYGLVKKGTKAGFYITWPGKKDDESFIVFKTENETLRLPVYRQHNTNRELANVIWHNANPVRFVNAVRYYKEHGLSGLKQKANLEIKRFATQLKKGENFRDIEYNSWFLKQSPDEEELETQKNTVFTYNPKISIIVAAFNTPISYLNEMISSVLNQTYSNWELCISDGSTNSSVENEIKNRYGNEARIKYTKLSQNYGIAGNMNRAMDLATGDYISLFDHDDLLTPDCLYEIVKSLQSFRYDVIYTDEDKLNDMTKGFMDPHFKPDFSIDQLRSHNYITHFLSVSRSLIQEVGQLNSEYDGSQDHDFILRATEKANAVLHIPKVLYHWRMHPSSTAMNPESKMYCYRAGQNAVQAQLDRLGIAGHVEMMNKPLYGMYHVKYDTSSNPLVSIIIPNKDHINDLETCISSIMKKSEYENFEIIVVENNSENLNTFKYYEKLQSVNEKVKVVKWDYEFNYPEINNFGRQFANGELLLFLNNDTELISAGSLREMVGLALQPDIGAVGAKLLYKDHTIQHAGVVLGYKGYATHAFLGEPDMGSGHMSRPQIVSNYSAVTAACLMVKTSDFDEVDGFDPQFVVAVNDVDLCLKLRKLGRRNVYTPFSKWFHYESKSRGLDYSGDNNDRFQREVELFQKKWPDAVHNPDPFHNVNFDLDRGAFAFYK